MPTCWADEAVQCNLNGLVTTQSEFEGRPPLVALAEDDAEFDAEKGCRIGGLLWRLVASSAAGRKGKAKARRARAFLLRHRCMGSCDDLLLLRMGSA